MGAHASATKMMKRELIRYRARNYACREQKCGQYPQISIAASEELKADVIERSQAEGKSVSNWVRGLIERELKCG